MPHEGYHRIEVPTTVVEQDAQYYMARIEGQLARIERWNELGGSGIDLGSIINEAKGFLSSLRSALSPHRIDVA